MKCQTTELEIETLVRRIRDKDMDLQPDFQRGEIWPVPKKKKLIDSILRGWRIPPIHVVRNAHNIDEVLDGQQRLAAIRDFSENKICVDGSIQPLDSNIEALDGMYYAELPVEIQRAFRQYSVNVVRLTEYEPEEPAELFYRLNQPTSLTSAEQRNAYIGKTRDQVKELSNLFISLGASKEVLGFSNSRLAYDEIISKLCYVVQIGTLKKKITSTDISEQYRQEIPFTDECVRVVKASITKFLNAASTWDSFRFHFNKATLFSWLVFTRQHLDILDDTLGYIIGNFEFCRSYIKGKLKNVEKELITEYEYMRKQLPFFEMMLNTFNQRSSMGSTDALSIIFRDIIIHLYTETLTGEGTDLLRTALSSFAEHGSMNMTLEAIQDLFNWGETF